MIRKTLKVGAWVGGGLALVLVAAVAAIAVALWSGPIDASFIAPQIERALAPGDGRWAVRSRDTQIAWEGWTKGIRIQVSGVRAVRRDGSELVKLPRLSVRLRIPALLGGRVAVTQIALHGPEIRVERDADGRFNLGLARSKKGGEPIGERFLEALTARRDDSGPAGRLDAVEIVAGRLTIVDPTLDRTWRTRNLNAVLRRDGAGIRGRLTFDLTIAGEVVRFSADADHRRDSRTTSLEFRFKGLDPALFASARGAMSALTWIKVPLSGTGTVRFDAEGAVRHAAIDFTGDGGVIDIPGAYQEPLPVKSVRLKGELDDDGRRLSLDTLDADLGFARLSAQGVFTGSADAFVFRGKTSLTGLPAARLGQLWPERFEASAKQWVATNITEGTIDRLDVTVRLDKAAGPGQKPRMRSLEGRFRYTGLDVRFYKHLPKVTDVDGTADFDTRRLRFDIARGRISEISVGRSEVVVGGFDEPKQSLSVTSRFTGPMPEILRALDRKPLGFARKLGVNPLALKGRADATIRVDFRLLKQMSIDDVALKADAKIAGLFWRKGLFGLDVDTGAFDLSVDKAGLRMKGKARLGGEPATIDWRERFGETEQPRRELSVKSSFSPQTLAGAGLDIRSFMSGPFGAELEIKGYDDGRNVISGNYDFEQTRFRIPVLSIVKPAGMKARGRSRIVLRNQRIAAVPEFALDTPVIKAAGRAEFHGDGETLKLLSINRLRAGLTDASLRIAGTANGDKTVTLTGKAFDLRPLLEPDEAEKARPKAKVRSRIVAKLDRAYLDPERHIDSVRGELSHDGTHWTGIDLFGRVGGNAALTLRFSRSAQGRKLTVRSADAGATLRTFKVTDAIRGGQLELVGRAPPGKSELSGTAVVKDFRVSEAPTLARILALASQEGLSNWASTDKGIAFRDFSSGFRVIGDTLYLREGRAVGSQLGVTVSGAINVESDKGKLVGTVVPLYTLNSAIGKVPLLGRVLVGEKGGGLFAVRYTVQGDMNDPAVSVNPLSMLTPGIFRRLFDLGNQAPRPDDERPKAPSGPEMLDQRKQGIDR